MESKTPKTVQIGDAVTYVDEVRVEHDALVTEIFGREVKLDGSGEEIEGSPCSCINVVWVSKDKNKTDQYGRQIKRETSCSHSSSQSAGRYWK